MGACTSARELEEAILAYIAATNADPKPFTWTKTADDILARSPDSANEPLTQTTSGSLDMMFGIPAETGSAAGYGG